MSALIMIVSAAAIIALVKFGLLRGIDNIANAMNWSAKSRGQFTGYATSVPEFVCLVSAGLAGVWEAGLWNIVSSNIINAGLMLLAVLYYRQFGELLNRRFVDEVGFAITQGRIDGHVKHEGRRWWVDISAEEDTPVVGLPKFRTMLGENPVRLNKIKKALLRSHGTQDQDSGTDD